MQRLSQCGHQAFPGSATGSFSEVASPGSALHTLLEREWEGMKEIRQISPQENKGGGFP